MTQNKSTRLVIAFVISCVAVGAPYWLIPYNKVNLPNALMGPGLLVIILAALMLRLYETTPFWRIVKIIGATVPAAVLTRIIVDGLKDPSSHNLWPLEVIIALVIGLCCALIGAIVGSLCIQLSKRHILRSRGDNP
ncbi:MAG: hypothetical protein ACU4EQ_00295 [Candidatus Nitrosoglobus sp.]|jgi:hypothetical protein